MEPPIQRDRTGKTGLSKLVITLLVIGTLLFVAAGAIAVYAAMKANETVQDTIQDLSKPSK